MSWQLGSLLRIGVDGEGEQLREVFAGVWRELVDIDRQAEGAVGEFSVNRAVLGILHTSKIPLCSELSEIPRRSIDDSESVVVEWDARQHV